ncbi:MAG: hypothetical protein IPI58_05205 [Alphaproteobacteria bacterium]|nr:MAG: hypothetical protein IPI58_05205 [Alphaproteobacteria bacterium]
MAIATEHDSNACWFGPGRKRPGWSLAGLARLTEGAAVADMNEMLDRCRHLLALPDDYVLMAKTAGETGAFESVLWSMLGPQPVDVFAWDVVGRGWMETVTRQLQVPETRCFMAADGGLPDLTRSFAHHDIVLTWCAPGAGVRVPDASWVLRDRAGLVLCDASAAAFTQPLPWRQFDAVALGLFSGLGAAPGLGLVALSPQAMDRLAQYQPTWPIPAVLALEASDLGTAWSLSDIDFADGLDALIWAESVGGAAALMERTRANTQAVLDGLESCPVLAPVPEREEWLSPGRLCLKPAGPAQSLTRDEKKAWRACLLDVLAASGVAYGVAPLPGSDAVLQLCLGPVVETETALRLGQNLTRAAMEME